MKEPARLWTLRDGTMRLLKPRAQADQIMRVAFEPSGTAIAAGIAGTVAGSNGMVGMWDRTRLDQLRNEPMCFSDAMANPIFSSDGKMVVTLSGAFWSAMYTVRAWDVSGATGGRFVQTALYGKESAALAR